jgi:hypothetical protein
MSAVIWCGIVAVWVFVLIPTWVRRGDLHWHRGNVGTTVVAEGPAEKSSGRAGHSERATGRRLLRRSRADLSIEVEAMAEQDAQSPVKARVSGPSLAPAPRARVAAAPSSGRLGSTVRASFGTGPDGSGRKKPPIRVRRARRLVVLAALALGTLIAAIASGGLIIALNIVCDIALILYVRHLRSVARAKVAKAAREKRARLARQAWDEASAQDRASQLDGWSAPAAPVMPEVAMPETEPYETADAPFVDDELEYAADEEAYEEVSYEESGYEEVAYAEEPAEIDLNAMEQPALIDLTDAPTEELAAAQAS